MAKTIKFNLVCDEKPIRTISDLQHNFSIEDVLAYYNNGLLHRWLSVRGYEQKFKLVSAITSKNQMDIIKELIEIFKVPADEKSVEESIYMLEFQEKQSELLSNYEHENYKVTNIIDGYEKGYRQLVHGILANPSDIAKIKASLKQITDNYAWIFKLNRRNLFYNWQIARNNLNEFNDVN